MGNEEQQNPGIKPEDIRKILEEHHVQIVDSTTGDSATATPLHTPDE